MNKIQLQSVSETPASMAEPSVADPIPNFDTLPIPPLDDIFFSDNNLFSFADDVDFDALNLDFSFDDDINLPSDTEHFINSTFSNPILVSNPSDPQNFSSNSKSSAFHQDSDDQCFNGAGYYNHNSSESGEKSFAANPKVSGDAYLNVSSSGSPDFSNESGDKHFGGFRASDCGSPGLVAHNREYSGPTVSQGSDSCSRSVASSHNFGNNSVNGIVNQKIESEESGKENLLKRKKEIEDVNSELKRTIKLRQSNIGTIDEEDKKKARLMRNRESAHLSRQRKKQYVDELEDKVRAMHTTIQDLNAKISYIVAENTTLRQQMNGGGTMVPPPMPGMYPHLPMAPMGYPWMPYPPYVVKSQGSQVPLVPIPKLKPQRPKRVESEKTEGKSKTKKVASVSFLGLLFFILLFGGLVPMVNVKYGGMRDAISGRSDYLGNMFNVQHHDSKVLMVNGTSHESGKRISNKNFDAWKSYGNTVNCEKGHVGSIHSNIEQSVSEDFACLRNASEPLSASLYVPRNDKLVKIDGNLIIHSILASEKAMASWEDREKGTSLAVPNNLTPATSIPGIGQNRARHPHLPRIVAEQRALASGSAGNDNINSTPTDGKLQQWFREGLAGPMLSSSMCTEVFQFDVLPSPGAIIPAASVRNITVEESQNSTRLSKGNRRFLQGLPIPLGGSSKESTGSNSNKENSHRNSSLPPMVVSVLVDPREVGNADGDGMMGTKSLSRIFVVVLLDSVKYVTYSCILPFKGSHQLVTS